MKMIFERIGRWCLKVAGVEILSLPLSMEEHRAEIIALCREEDDVDYGTTDILGNGYFRYRRVCTKMLKAHPSINKRDLSKMVVLCSDLIASGR